jgi:hypothetical protein
VATSVVELERARVDSAAQIREMLLDRLTLRAGSMAEEAQNSVHERNSSDEQMGGELVDTLRLGAIGFAHETSEPTGGLRVLVQPMPLGGTRSTVRASPVRELDEICSISAALLSSPLPSEVAGEDEVAAAYSQVHESPLAACVQVGPKPTARDAPSRDGASRDAPSSSPASTWTARSARNTANVRSCIVVRSCAELPDQQRPASRSALLRERGAG